MPFVNYCEQLFVPFDVFIERLCLKFPVHSANIQDHERDIAHFVGESIFFFFFFKAALT